MGELTIVMVNILLLLSLSVRGVVYAPLRYRPLHFIPYRNIVISLTKAILYSHFLNLQIGYTYLLRGQ